MSKFESIDRLWENMEKSADIPYRADYQLDDLEALEPAPLLLEKMSDEDYRIRFAPFCVHELFGAELRGRNFLTVIDGLNRAEVSSICQSVNKGKVSANIEFTYANFAIYCGLYPMRTETGSIDYLFGIIDLCEVPESQSDPIDALSLHQFQYKNLTQNYAFSTSGMNYAEAGMAEGRRLFTAKPTTVFSNKNPLQQSASQASPFKVIGKTMKREP